MTQARHVPQRPQSDEIKAIVLLSDDGKYTESVAPGWSCINEPDDYRKGLVIDVDDGIEVIIPFDQIRKFYNYMVLEGV